MPKVTPITTRKSDHIRINLEQDVASGVSTGLEHYRFIHRALPEVDLEAVDLSQDLFGRHLQAPLLISSMTGGVDGSETINRALAEGAQQARIAMGVGSQRAALQHPDLAYTFQVRRYAPDILLLANLGAIQLNYGYGVDECRQVIDMIEADALILHFNALQEAVQPEGETRWSGLAGQVAAVCKALPVPVIAKEVGWGFSALDVRLLLDAGVAAIDVAGAGGTSWSQVEMHRAQNDSQRRLAAAFVEWGIPTANAIRIVRDEAPGLAVIATGGLRTGVDIAKCLALGACLGGMAGPFLKAAVHGGADDVALTIAEVRREVQVCMFAAGVRDLKTLQSGQCLVYE